MNDLATKLFESKVRDYKINAASMPPKARVLSKTFAHSLGKTAEKILTVFSIRR
jgi:hypothetical protein